MRKILARDMIKALSIDRSMLNTYIYHAAPDEWEFEKEYKKEFSRGRFLFNEQDYKLFYRIRELRKENKTYKQCKEIVTKEFIKGGITMNNLKVFNHSQFGAVRTIYNEKQDEVWFVAKDITDSLGLSNTTIALQGLEDFERTKLNLGRQGETNVISESGVYALIMRSRKEEAKKFRIWVTSEVLPSIRKSGGYIQNQENSTPEQILANAVLVAQNVIKEKELQLEREKLLRQEAEETIKLQSPKVQAWEQFMDLDRNLDMGATARAFNVRGLGRNNFMKLLRDKEVLQNNNNPYQHYMDRGYFEVVIIPNEFAQTKTVVTPKGLKWLAGKLVEWNYIG